MTAGELLREARVRHGLSQTQLARRAGTSQAAISRIERGLVSPTFETLTTLLDKLGEELVLTAQEIDYGHDPTLLRANLQLSPTERLAHATERVKFYRELLGRARA